MIETGLVVIISVSIISVCSLVGYIAKLLFYSKCNSCSCLGVKVHRNTAEERQTVESFQLPKTMNLN